MAGERIPRRVFRTVITGSGLLVGLAAFLIGLVVAYDVTGRTLFGITTTGVTDVSRYLMGFITFVGAGYALREDAHVSVDILTSRLGATSQGVLRVMCDVIVLSVTAVLLWLGIELWWDAWVSGERSWGVFTVDLWIPYISFPLGIGLLLAVQIDRTLSAGRRNRR